MPITVADQAKAIARAKQALTDLEQHSATTQNQLGTARDHLNRTRNHSDPTTVWAAVTALEDLVGQVTSTR